MPIAVSGAIGPCEAPQPPPLSGVGVATGVAGADVAVAGGGTGVAVGGTCVGVAVGGTGVAVGGTCVGVAVGGTGVAVGGTCVAVGVSVGGTSVAVGSGVGNPVNTRLTVRNSPGLKFTDGLGGADCMPFRKKITGMPMKFSVPGSTTRLLYPFPSMAAGSDS